jgi:hypothetical protein
VEAAHGQQESLAKRKHQVSERLLMAKAAIHGLLHEDRSSAKVAVGDNADTGPQ